MTFCWPPVRMRGSGLSLMAKVQHSNSCHTSFKLSIAAFMTNRLWLIISGTNGIVRYSFQQPTSGEISEMSQKPGHRGTVWRSAWNPKMLAKVKSYRKSPMIQFMVSPRKPIGVNSIFWRTFQNSFNWTYIKIKTAFWSFRPRFPLRWIF